MNLLLLEPGDFVDARRVRLSGRRLKHVVEVHGAAPGDELRVGLLGGLVGHGKLLRLTEDLLEMEVHLDQSPPAKLPLSLLLALPRPKVLNRVLASAASLGVARIVLVNAWRVEKAYWKSPRLDPAALREQLILGLEQARDTVLPELRLARLFKPFIEDELDGWCGQGQRILAHPGAAEPCPRGLEGPCVLAIGPEGGWIEAEQASFARAGFREAGLGPRILRVETALAALIGRLY